MFKQKHLVKRVALRQATLKKTKKVSHGRSELPILSMKSYVFSTRATTRKKKSIDHDLKSISSIVLSELDSQ